MKQHIYLGGLFLAALLGGETAATAGSADPKTDVDASELVDQLKPDPAKGAINYEGVPDRTYRGLTLDASEAEGVEKSGDKRSLPTVALDVQFAFDSAELTKKARKQLSQVAKAFKAGELSGYHFLLEGHTDSVGPASYNQELSERRAQSVRRYLVETHDISASRLATRGHGERYPLRPDSPKAAVNRRVEITNIGRTQSASSGSP